jgi:hypothetical protein
MYGSGSASISQGDKYHPPWVHDDPFPLEADIEVLNDLELKRKME